MNNQTEEVWLMGGDIQDTGTGVFIFPQANSATFGLSNWRRPLPDGSMTKALVKDLTYVDCVARGSHDWILAFKWVPDSLADFSAVSTAAAACGTVRCVRRCAKYGCLCVAGMCK
jgi:hypothetical protein